MKYFYAYKTSDGKRHEAEIDAASREAVFESLRAQGIRAIKVVAADGSKANGEVRGVRTRVLAFSVAAAAILAGSLVYVFVAGNETRETRLPGEVESIRERLGDAYSALNMDRLLDYPAVVAATNVTELFRLADRGAALVERARKDTREAFARLADERAADAEYVREVQRIYGERMAEIDALEIANANRKFALALLDANRDKWKLKDGEPVFSDERLAQMFKYCIEGISTDAATSRWRKDQM